MPTHLYITPTLAAAFEHINQRATQQGGRRWLLTPTEAVADFVTIPHDPAWQFATLAEALVQTYDSPDFTIASRLYGLRLLANLLEEQAEAGQIPALAAVAQKRGMAREVNRWIRELETQGIDPATIAAHDPANPVEQALSHLYEQYQIALLKGQQADTDGMVGVAVAVLAGITSPYLAEVHLTVVGFDQFEPMPRRLLRLLAERVAHVDLYLAGDPQRPPDSLALARLGESYRAIQTELVPDEEHVLPFPATLAPALRQIHLGLFEHTTLWAERDHRVQFIAAPSREAEVRATLRASKQLLQSGVAPRDISVLAADTTLYQRSIQAVAAEYGIPVQLSQPLLSNPAVAAWAALLSLAPRFPRRETMDALRSPYVQHGLTVEELDMLERLTRERPVIATIEQWLAALQPYRSQNPTEGMGDDDLGPPPLWHTVLPEVMDGLREKVRILFRLLTPPHEESSFGFGRWLTRTLLGDEDDDSPSLALRTTAATFESANRDNPAFAKLVEVIGILNRSGDGRRLSWEKYRADLLDLVGEMMVALPAPTDALYFGSLLEGRQRVMPHLFVLGLNEGEFPRLPAPDLFYAPAEREAHPYLRQEFVGDDASLWWQTVSNVTETLTLLRPRLDEKGNGTLASPYWAAVLRLFQEKSVVTPRVEEVPAWEEAIGLNEQLVAVANGSAPAMLPDGVQLMWRTVNRAEEIRHERQTMAPAGIYEGVIHHPALLAELQRRYGANRDWSVSQLHRYAECPYGFFAQHVLTLRPITEPEEGLDPRTTGQIYHAILELLYAWMRDTDCLPAPDHQSAILTQLDALCDENFRTALGRYQFRPGAMWIQEQREMRRHLHALLKWECEQNRQHIPYEQERRFGNITGSHQRVLEIEADGTSFRLQGVIDRIDHAADGSGSHIVDYKSGNTKYDDQKIGAGRALQTALYALALEKMGFRVRSSRYLLIRKREASGVLEFEEQVADHETVQAALGQVADFLRSIQAGQFPAAPIEPTKSFRACREGCDLAAICRVTRLSWQKDQL